LSKWLTVVIAAAMLISAFYSITHMAGAADTYKALAAGRYYIDYGVSTTDPFSRNSLRPGPTAEQIRHWPEPARRLADKAGLETIQYWYPTGWINQNWLAGVLFYWLAYLSPIADAQQLSFNSLVYLKFALYLLTVICIYLAARTMRAGAFLSALFACFSIFVGRTFFNIRPADFTNLCTAVFILILALTTYRNSLYIWLFIPLVVVWSNLHGGFMYAFAALTLFTIMHIVASTAGKQLVSIELKGICHCILTGITTLLVVIILSPYHLTNITHTFVVTLDKNAGKWQSSSEWRPAFDFSSTFGNTAPFVIMLIIASITVLIYLAVLPAASRLFTRRTGEKTGGAETYSVPKIDLALTAVAAATVYMAVLHRRFIPMAAITACPVIAMLTDQTTRTIAAARNLIRKGIPAVPALSRRTSILIIVLPAVFIVCFALWCGLEFKRVYLDNWPPDQTLDSVFMRMTGSSGRGFDACRFMNQNHLKGMLFCYWTEGSFIALQQTPEPNTGRIPLQLFMDSRAQTAYPLEMQTLWAEIMHAGPTVKNARRQRRPLTNNDYRKITAWLDNQLKKHSISVALMPSDKWQTPFVRALENSGRWRLVYFDNKQKLFADITTAQGKQLYEGILTGGTLYPNRLSKEMTAAYQMMTNAKTETEKTQAFERSVAVFKLFPCPATLEMVLSAGRFPQLRPPIVRLCTDFLERFEKDKSLLQQKNGYFNKLRAAISAVIYLGKTAERQGSVLLAQSYHSKLQELQKERQNIIGSKTW